MVLFVDSCHSFNNDMIKKMGVEILPYPIFVNKEPYDIEQYPTEEAIESLRNTVADKNNTVTTSGLNPGYIKQMIEKYSGEEIIIMTQAVTINSRATYEAINNVLKEMPDSPVRFIDSNHLAGGYAVQVLKAAEIVKKSSSLDEAVEAIKKNRENTRHLAAIYDLFFLNRTGRLGLAKAIMASTMKIIPLLQATKEEPWVIKGIGKARTFMQGNQKFLEVVRGEMEEKESRDITLVASFNGSHGKDAQHFKEILEAEGYNAEVIITGTTPPNMVHMGPEFLDLGYIIHEN